MANLLGGTDPDVFDRYLHVMAADPAVKVHFYGKDVRPGRKIGHVTIVAGPATESRSSATAPAVPPATCAGEPKTATDAILPIWRSW